MKTLKLIVALFAGSIICLWLGGCSIVPTEKNKSEAVKSSENISNGHDTTIRRTVEVIPEAVAAISQWGTGTVSRSLPAVRESLTIHDVTDQSAGSTGSARGASATSIPLGVKLALIGIGIIILTVGILFLWRYVKTTALGQGLRLADEKLAAVIERKREKAMLSTDPATVAGHMSEIAALESDRGKLAASK